MCILNGGLLSPSLPRQGSLSLNLSLLIEVGQLAGELQGSVCFCLPSAGILGACCYA